MAKFFDSPAMRESIRRLIRARMAYKGYEYKDLTRRLGEFGVVQHECNLRSKVNNGSLGAQLFLYILLALDVDVLNLGDVETLLGEVSEADASQSEESAA